MHKNQCNNDIFNNIKKDDQNFDKSKNFSKLK